MADVVKENIEMIRSSIANNVVVVAASKTRTVDEIKQAILGGISEVGENYVQEAEAKYGEKYGELREFLKQYHAKLHLIGHLQSNKAKKAVEIFDVIQTIDTVKIAQIVNDKSAAISKVIEVMIEVNVANEENKHGCKIEEVEKIAKEILKMKNLKLVGLMTMGPMFGQRDESEKGEKLRPFFKQLKQKFDEMNGKLAENGFKFKYLCMGMSDSYHVAIEEGSNMVRIGSKIFGERK